MVPAVCEEIFFRGFLFSACRTSYSKWTTIFLTAFLFGLFHVLATADMMYVRFFPSFALGILIGLMRWHSGSLFPGMFFHVVHNGLLITVSSFPDEIAEYVDWAGEYREHLPLPLIIVSLIIALIAATWFIREQAKSRSGT
ncbi:MAG: hypothetical protein CMJ46_10055 [Planctomyces sp.]|nr:hypothetical protein [Planctomyces sp.]